MGAEGQELRCVSSSSGLRGPSSRDTSSRGSDSRSEFGRKPADVAEEEAFTRAYNDILAAKEKQKRDASQAAAELGIGPKQSKPKVKPKGWREMKEMEVYLSAQAKSVPPQ